MLKMLVTKGCPLNIQNYFNNNNNNYANRRCVVSALTLVYHTERLVITCSIIQPEEIQSCCLQEKCDYMRTHDSVSFSSQKNHFCLSLIFSLCISSVSSVGSSWFLFHHWYCVGVGFGLLIMVLAVCITHWKTKSNKETTNKTPTVYSTKKDNNTNSS